MALAPTLYDFDVSLSHVDRAIDQRLKLRTARHPSEALERVWLRVLAFCWLWDERLAFGPGLSDPEAPDLVSTDLTGAVTRWVRVGKAEPAKIRKAAQHHPGAQVAVFFDSPHRLDAFVEAASAERASQLSRVTLAAVDPSLLAALAKEDGRRQQLGLTIVGDHFYAEHLGRTLDGPLAQRTVA